MKHKAYNPLKLSNSFRSKHLVRTYVHERNSYPMTDSDKAKLTIAASRDKFVALCEQHRYVPPMPKTDWRFVDNGPYGQPSGIPSFFGRLVATNGLLCLIETISGLVWSHSDSFKPDKAEKAERRAKKQTKFDLLLEKLLA